jgi:sulfoxide reductase heme-binding subunit YedZ
LLHGIVVTAAVWPLAFMAAAVAGIGPYELGADPAREILHRCGLLALQLLCLTLCITPLRVLTGWQFVHPLRRTLGLLACGYAVLHLLVWAWLLQGLDVAAMLDDIVERPYITLGMVAVLLLCALAATSTRGWQRRLRRRWQQLHYAVYPAAILAVWHFWWQVKKDIREPLVYAVVLGALLLWRLQRRVKVRSGPARVRGTP